MPWIAASLHFITLLAMTNSKWRHCEERGGTTSDAAMQDFK